MKKNKTKIKTFLPAVGKCVGIVLIVSLFPESYSTENNSPNNLDNAQDKVRDASDAIATNTKKAYYKTKDALSDTGEAVTTKTKKAYYKAKDAVTPEPSEEIAKVND